jgi:predicted nuclease with TOPRIM domain
MKRAARETVEMEDFKSDLDALRIKRAAFEEQLSKGDGNARSLQDQLREIDAQIVALEGAAATDNAP